LYELLVSFADLLEHFDIVQQVEQFHVFFMSDNLHQTTVHGFQCQIDIFTSQFVHFYSVQMNELVDLGSSSE